MKGTTTPSVNEAVRAGPIHRERETAARGPFSEFGGSDEEMRRLRQAVGSRLSGPCTVCMEPAGRAKRTPRESPAPCAASKSCHRENES